MKVDKMLNNKGKRSLVLITPRDIKLLEFVFESKVVTFKQLALMIFPGKSITTARARVNKLRKEGLIDVSGMYLRNQRFFSYSLTKKGLSLLVQHSSNFIDRKNLISDSIYHDLTLVDIVLSLRRFSRVKRLLSENALSCYKNVRENEVFKEYSLMRSDGMIELYSEKRQLLAALEYDRTEKSKSRYMDKFRKYYDSKINGVLYICETKSMLENLMSIDEKICDNKSIKFFFTLKDDVLSGKKEIHFKNFKGHSFIVH